MMKKFCNPDVGILLLRVVVGMVFVAHGWQKFQNISGVGSFFASQGFPMPQLLAYLVAFVEFAGGIAVILGAFTWLAGMLLAFIMIVAIFAVKGLDKFVGGYEFELVLLGASLAIAKIHPGKYSVMRAMKKENQMV